MYAFTKMTFPNFFFGKQQLRYMFDVHFFGITILKHPISFEKTFCHCFNPVTSMSNMILSHLLQADKEKSGAAVSYFPY